MDSGEIAARMRVAEALARDAGRLALDLRTDRPRLDIRRKGPQDVVTAADVAVERMLVTALRSRFPGDGILGEEEGGGARPGAPCWVVDPIDGTSNYARALPHWCVSIALVIDGRTEVGVIHEPAADALYAARRGAGATRDGLPLRIGRTDDLASAIVDVGYSARTPAGAYGALVSDLLQRGVGVLNCGSAALGLARVADGRLDGYAERHLYAWDALAGLLLVEEAGGRTRPFLDGDAMTTGNETIAATPELFATLVDVMSAHRP
ncbi:MAG: inositol monophosphatase [Betaproteobacteria bacterium PRO3]|nr:inositol monophosphatase [Betaproteobacteria bacterium PRO3]